MNELSKEDLQKRFSNDCTYRFNGCITCGHVDKIMYLAEKYNWRAIDINGYLMKVIENFPI